MLWPVSAEPTRARGRFAVAVAAAALGGWIAPWSASTALAQEREAARAAASAAVYVEAGECASAPLAQVLSLLRVELGARLRERPELQVVRVRIECSGDDVLVTASPPDAPVRSQRLSLTAVPVSLRPRIVALQAAEIVRESELPAAQDRVQPAREPRLPSTAAAPGDPARTSGARDAAVLHHGVQLQLFAQASSYHRDGRWLGGAGVRVELALFSLRVGIDGAFATRGDASQLGSDRVLSAYLAPHVAWPFTAGRMAARLGVGHAIGFARITGDSSDPAAVAGTVSGPWMAPFMLAGASYALGSAFALQLRAEAGWVVLSVIGEVARAQSVELSGLWTNLQLGVALAF
jgi:hypothetical protein